MTKYNVISAIQSMYGSNWQMAVFQHYCGRTIPANQNVLSPLRDNDTAASLRIFQSEDGDYLAYDYGRNETHNVWSFACAHRDNKDNTDIGYSQERANLILDEDLNLGFNNADPFWVNIPVEGFGLSDRSFAKNDPPEIAVFPKEWGGVDSNYWGQYFITEDDLAFFDCGVSQKTLFSYDKGFVWKDYHYYKQSDPGYYYYFTDSNGRSKFKILRPYANDSMYKWRTNIDKHDLTSIQGFAQADLTQETAILTSSMKDVITLRKIGYTAYALHGEAYIPTKEFVDHLHTYHKNVIVFMDNDEAGRVATGKLLRHDAIFTRSLFIPDGLSFENGKLVKDPSDYIKWSNGNFEWLQQFIEL